MNVCLPVALMLQEATNDKLARVHVSGPVKRSYIIYLRCGILRRPVNVLNRVTNVTRTNT